MNLTFSPTADKPFFTECSSHFAGFLYESLRFWDRTPLLREAFAKDLRVDALASKHERRRRRQDTLAASMPLEGFEEGHLPQACSLALEEGRPRMPTKMVFLFTMVRGWIGSVCSTKARDLMIESHTLNCILQQHGMDLPGTTTILENVNAVSEKTLRLMHRLHLQALAEEGLEDFASITADSTAVEASSAWPSDSKLIYKFLERAVRLSAKLERYGLSDLSCKCVDRWLEDLRKGDFAIAMVRGKADAKRRRRRGYRAVYNSACKILRKVSVRLSERSGRLAGIEDLTPLRREACGALIDQIAEDLSSASAKMRQSMNRIEKDLHPNVRERILSVTDKNASLIIKGGREPAMGYKPQLARSKKGVVTAILLEEGNGSDSQALEPLIKASLKNTQRPLESVSVDDGYASAEGLEALRNLGVEKTSISGSKGRKLLGEELWQDAEYDVLRNDRSAVESLMYVLKYSFAFDRMGRRGLENVRKEMLEKILAYNVARGLRIRTHHQNAPPDKQAA